MMTEEYCPRNELQKTETKLWNLSIEGTDIIGYTKRFQDLALLFRDIQGKVTASKPTKIQEAICMVHNLMDQVVRAKVAKDAENKIKREDDQEGNHFQRQNKRHEVVRVYAVGTSNKTWYAGTLPPYDRYNLHHHLCPCPAQCGNCWKFGHQARDCWTPTLVTCYECGEKGHNMKYCPNLEDQNEAAEAYQDPNVVMGTFLLKNRYILV
ncbi:reverse transcriptase domain-containing protein [Tanacetum coccineum]